AIGALALVSLLSGTIPFLSPGGAPEFHRALIGSRWSAPLLAANALTALGAGISLIRRAYPQARACAASQVTLLLAGWGMAQYPYLIKPDLLISSSAASPEMLRLLLIILAAGAVFLFPAIYFLFRVFKKKPSSADVRGLEDSFRLHSPSTGGSDERERQAHRDVEFAAVG
ncbi:MAG: putative Cytochrome bd2, subunit, partial [Deltaproteobacteria bacterium]|nr:putative Cytochrome bd2, subunit [Deltaproteobacteria bacterium]